MTDATQTDGQEQDGVGDVFYDEKTLEKVYDGLERAGVTGQQALDAVSQIQNLGILFRERGKF